MRFIGFLFIFFILFVGFYLFNDTDVDDTVKVPQAKSKLFEVLDEVVALKKASKKATFIEDNSSDVNTSKIKEKVETKTVVSDDIPDDAFMDEESMKKAELEYEEFLKLQASKDTNNYEDKYVNTLPVEAIDVEDIPILSEMEEMEQSAKRAELEYEFLKSSGQLDTNSSSADVLPMIDEQFEEEANLDYIDNSEETNIPDDMMDEYSMQEAEENYEHFKEYENTDENTNTPNIDEGMMIDENLPN
jgi:hypothetical protein